MAENPVAIDNLMSRWRPLTDQETQTAQVLLDDAWMILGRLYPVAATVSDDDTDLITVLSMITCNMVKRAMTAATPGLAQESTTTGPYSHSMTYSNPDGDLYVTRTEDGLIRGYHPRAASVQYDC